ncbi:MAG: phosphoribosylformylglycinamidine synthase subunit PurS [Candidatus Micrarchaeota archaeon]|nr:phosphoribosylformylglycinamidine synthase subunit PurS [Candidatus Micrarchaeota archaeon]
MGLFRVSLSIANRREAGDPDGEAIFGDIKTIGSDVTKRITSVKHAKVLKFDLETHRHSQAEEIVLGLAKEKRLFIPQVNEISIKTKQVGYLTYGELKKMKKVDSNVKA